MILAFNIADIIRVPFGYLLDLLYQFTTSYGLALILFALIVKLILLPASAKSKKSMMKMSRPTGNQQAVQRRRHRHDERLPLELCASAFAVPSVYRNSAALDLYASFDGGSGD